MDTNTSTDHHVPLEDSFTTDITKNQKQNQLRNQSLYLIYISHQQLKHVAEKIDVKDENKQESAERTNFYVCCANIAVPF